MYKKLILKLARDKLHILKTVEHYEKLNPEQRSIKNECLQLIAYFTTKNTSGGYQPVASGKGEPLPPPKAE